MFSFFRKKNQPSQPIPESEFYLARSPHGFVRHITKGNGTLTSLCNSEILDQWMATTREELVNDLPRQHETFFYCVACTAEFTGLSEDEVVNQRSTAFVRPVRGVVS